MCSSDLLLTSVTLGSIRNHVQSITESSNLFIGTCPGVSNLRDLDINNQGGTILQQANPAIYSALFLNNSAYSFVDSVINSQQEYTRFKNKFLSLAVTSPNIANLPAPSSVDIILKQIKKTEIFFLKHLSRVNNVGFFLTLILGMMLNLKKEKLYYSLAG